MRRRSGAALLGAALACAALPGVAHADTLDAANARRVAGQRRDQLDLGGGRGAARDLDAGGLRVPGDRVLARRRTPARWSRRSSRTSRSPRSCTGRSGSRSPSASATSSATTGSSCATTAIRRRRSRSWACRTPRSRASGCSSSRSAPSRWRSCGARRSSGSSSASTSSTPRSSPALIYPIASHWVFGGGWLQTNLGMQDFAGSTAVHLIGATGALAVLLQLGARRGKYGADGRPRAIPGHSMPFFGLGVLILWLGWFGFNPGSTLSAMDGRFPEIALVTMLAAAAGVLGAIAVARLEDRHDRHRHGRQRRDRRARRDHRPVGLRRAVGGADHRPDRGHHRAARRLRDRQEDRRPGRRADRARPVRRLGHARVRPLHRAAAGRVQRGSATRAWSTPARSISC